MAQSYTKDPYNSAHVVDTDMGEINDNFEALRSSFSGATSPANPIAGMWWHDTTSHILKQRNEANSAWLSVWDLANNKPVIDNLSDEITGAMISSAIKDAAAGTASLRTLGTAATQACAGNDSRLSDTRTPADSSVSQAKLKTSVGSVYLSGDRGSSPYTSNLTLPGGEYGFYPQLKTIQGDLVAPDMSATIASVITSASYVTNLYLTLVAGANYPHTDYAYAQQRYVTSSGEVFWIFMLRDRSTGHVIAAWQSPDHPCFGNGGKPLVAPHPFGSYDPAKHEIIVINPSEEDVFDMQDACIMPEDKPDRDILEVIMDDYEIDESSSPAWPKKEVTVGLPKGTDWKRMPEGSTVTPIKKVIPKPDGVIVRGLKRRKR